MIGREESNSEEQIELKVVDKRKFNSDGSLRDGVVIEPEEPKTENPVGLPVDTLAANENDTRVDPLDEELEQEIAETEFDESEIPGADDPASFINFLSTLASQAAAALGALPHPATGKRSVDLETGKYWIDVLAMLRDKTNGNLHPQEHKLFSGLLGDLQMQFVALTRASEEQLKKQAAQKFSASDILGKK